MFVFPGFLVLHAIGMGFLAGTNAVIDLRVLGVAPRVPITVLSKFFPVMWVGFAVNAVSGLLLLIAYPTKALTNPLFYFKLACVGAGVAVAFRMRRKLLGNPKLDFQPPASSERVWAVLSMMFWAGAIVAGRLLAYTCTYLMADSKC